MAAIRIRNLPQVLRRALTTADPRHVFYEAILKSSTFEEYFAKVGDVVVVPPTYRERIGASRELKYMRDRCGWVAEAEIAAELPAAEEFRPDPATDARLHVVRAVAQRQGQAAFRRDLIEIYDGRCAVTGCRVQPLLEAAHVTPYRGAYTNVLSNGILLRSDIHSLWDLGLLAVDPVQRVVQVNPDVAAADNMYGELNGVMISEPNQVTHRPSEAALRSQWDFFSALLA